MTNADLKNALRSGSYVQTFKDIMPFIYEWENVIGRGGKILVEDDKDDPGGATYCGLDRRSHPDLDFAKTSPKQVNDIYYVDYWKKYNCERFGWPLSAVVFNCCVNAGWGRAKGILAQTGNNAAKFLAYQAAFYHRLADARPKSAKYLKGWLNRLEDLAKRTNTPFKR